MSENVKITRVETMSQNFRHIVISTHKSVEMCRAETMCTFSLRKKFVKKCDIQTDGQFLLEDASRIKKSTINTIFKQQVICEPQKLRHFFKGRSTGCL